jgi:allantoin racemase
MYITEAGLTAETEGYSAVVMDTVSDSGLHALRSRLAIPVVGPGAVSYAIACLLGKRFSLLAYKDSHRFFYEKTLNTYGMAGRCASIRVANVEPDYERLIAEDSEADRRAFVDASWAAIRQDGADAIVFGSTTMHPLRDYLATELNVPVIDPGPLAIRIAEMLVQMDLSHSKVGFPTPSTISDETWFALPSS